MLKYILLIAISMLGCDLVQQSKIDVYYRRDAIIRYGGREYLGVAVLPRSAKYDLEIEFPGNLDLFTLRNCHREQTLEEFKDNGGWFSRKENKVSITYEPVHGLETPVYCPIDLSGFDADKGRNGWGFIDFESETEKLPALVKCSGRKSVANGVSVCQSLAGLMQQIVFSIPVQTAESDCFKPETKDQMTFTIHSPIGRCVYVFREMDGDKRFHRFTSIGYESILVRKAI